MQVTVCGKIKDISMYPALDGTAELMARVERLYFRERYIKGGEPNELKRRFLKGWGITGRQLNGVIFSLAGKVDATRKCLQRNLDTKERIKKALKMNERDWFKIHHLPTCKEPAEACLVGLASRIQNAGAEEP